MKRNAAPSEIERIEAPTLEHFQRHYVARGRPVIITGIANRWPAVGKWGPEYFKQVAGDSQVRVPFEQRGDFFSWFFSGGRSEKRIRFGELVDIVTAPEPDRRYYLQEQPLSDVSPKLLEDVDLKRYVGDVVPAMFMGRDTFMPCHFHGHTEALLCQLHEDKQVTLFSPDQWRKLYAHPWYSRRYQFSRVNVRSPDLAQYPRFRQAKPLTFTLRAGEILYIPVHWWHTTTCPVFNFNITFFWPSKLQCFHFPTPGIQYHAHWLLHAVVLRPLQWLRAAFKKRGQTASPSMAG